MIRWLYLHARRYVEELALALALLLLAIVGLGWWWRVGRHRDEVVRLAREVRRRKAREGKI